MIIIDSEYLQGTILVVSGLFFFCTAIIFKKLVQQEIYSRSNVAVFFPLGFTLMIIGTSVVSQPVIWISGFLIYLASVIQILNKKYRKK